MKNNMNNIYFFLTLELIVPYNQRQWKIEKKIEKKLKSMKWALWWNNNFSYSLFIILLKFKNLRNEGKVGFDLVSFAILVNG